MGARAVRALLERHGLRAGRDRGQNFLVDPDLARSLVRRAGVAPGDAVIEVGTGLGILTRALAETARRVVTVEVDAGLVRLLRAEALLPDNVELVHADVLRMDLAAAASALATEGPVRAVANLPYSVGARVLRRLLDLRGTLAGWAVMVQKEVGERLRAAPGTPDYGSLAVLHALLARVEPVRELAPGCFEPAPRVTSAFLRVTPRDDAPLGDAELVSFERFARAAFARRRKTLVNALHGGLDPAPDAEAIRTALATLGHDPRVRAERLPPEALLSLFRALE